MAFDAGMLSAVLTELNAACAGAKLEKIYQPAKEEVVFLLREGGETHQLLVNASSSAPRLTLSRTPRENPAVPPMFCMLLRKHLVGGRLLTAEQIGFERVARLRFAASDDMGYPCEKFLIAEIMGKYSNLMLTDEKGRILAVLRAVDFTTSRLRQVLPGMQYELPPAQNKRDPRGECREDFLGALAVYPPERAGEKFIVDTYLGTAAQVARELVWQASGRSDTRVEDIAAEKLWDVFHEWFAALAAGQDLHPVLMRGEAGAPLDYAYRPLHYLEGAATVTEEKSFAELFDCYFAERDRNERIRQQAADVLHLLTRAEARLSRKLQAQREELAECAQGEEYRRRADLITANLYRLHRGDTVLTAVDYTPEPPCEVTVELDARRTPSQNAQHFYKLYTKARNAKVALAEQIARSEQELAYVESVRAFLDRAETQADLSEIREELYRAGYASQLKHYTPQKKLRPRFTEFTTSGGYRLLVGRNNMQNDELTFHTAEKGDLWFHAKGVPGSHVILVCGGEEPPEKDYTEAAEIAAGYSQAGEGLVAVDYTRVRHLKKPPAAKPGYVIYHTNYTAYVHPRTSLGAEEKESSHD